MAAEKGQGKGRTASMWADGQWEMCVKLAELGADLNKADQVSVVYCHCKTLCCSIVVKLTIFFKLVGKDGLVFGFCEGSVGSVCETG